MSTAERTLAEKLADADFQKIARWLGDRLRNARRQCAWHAAHLRMILRDARGRPGKLPPGSLAMSCTREATSDDRFYLKSQRRHGPIFKLFWGSGDLKVCVIGFPLAKRLLRSHRGSLHPVSTDISSLVPAEYLRAMNPVDHRHYRRVFQGALQDDLVTALEPAIRGIIRRELQSLADDSVPGGQPSAGRLTSVLNRITTRTLLLLVLGIPPEKEIVPALEALYQRLGPDGFIADVGPQQADAFTVLRAMVLQVSQSMSHADGGGFGDSILRRLAQSRTSAAADETVIGNAIYMVERGRHDLRDLLRWIVKYLSDNPAVAAEVRASLARPGSDARLAEACVMETLRMDQAEVLNRKAMEPFTFQGYQIPKGAWVSILMRETHRDAGTFSEPDRFRPQRFLERSYSADEYAPFGIDEHQCIGRFLVIRAATMFVEELVNGYTWSVIGDGPRHYGHFHWQPSPSFAIALRRA